MKEIQIKDYKGTICIDSNGKMDKLRVTFVDDKGYPDSHYVFNLEVISNCSRITYIRQGGNTKFHSDGIEIHPCEYDYPVTPGSGQFVTVTKYPDPYVTRFQARRKVL